MARSTDITSFTEHRKHLRKHLDQCRDTGRPLFITSNGETDGVLLSAAAFDALAQKADLADTLLMLNEGLADAKANRGDLFAESIEKIADELNLPVRSLIQEGVDQLDRGDSILADEALRDWQSRHRERASRKPTDE